MDLRTQAGSFRGWPCWLRSMTRRTSIGTERNLERAQSAVEMIVKEPVKQAVREALAEEQIGERPTGGDGTGGSSKGSNRRLSPKLLLSLLGIATAALYWRRRKSDERDMTSVGEGSTGSTSSPESDEAAEVDDETTEQDAEGETTTSS